jgi:hypothetical protein
VKEAVKGGEEGCKPDLVVLPVRPPPPPPHAISADLFSLLAFLDDIGNLQLPLRDEQVPPVC